MTPIIGIMASSFRSAAGPDGAYDALATVTVPSGGLASITFAGIPNTYKHLQLRSSCLTAGWLTMRFNSDSTTGNYFGHEIRGNGTSATAQSQIGFATNLMWIGLPASGTHPLATITDVLDYSNTNKFKTVRALSGNDANGSGIIQLTSNAWAQTAAVSSLELQIFGGGNFSQHSQFTLYGVR
jgi:hypothetical protein